MDIEKKYEEISKLMPACLALYEMKQTIRQKENRKFCTLKSIMVYILDSYYNK